MNTSPTRTSVSSADRVLMAPVLTAQPASIATGMATGNASGADPSLTAPALTPRMADMSSEPGRRQPVTLIIPDLHQRLDWLDRILRRELRGRAGASRSVVFLGDYWDVPEFEIGAASPVDTLRRLVELRKKLGERLTLLIGNHDAAYLEPWFTHGIDAGGRAPAAPFA